MNKIDHASRRLTLAVLSSALFAFCIGGCAHPLVRNWQEYGDAKKRGDYVTAGSYLADDARIWHGTKEGEGHPLRARGGPYKDWDKEFKSTSTRRNFRAEGRTITYLSLEVNDYYRLLEGAMGEARITYYFDDAGKISGMFYRSVQTSVKPMPCRDEEFERWANEKYPGLLDSAEMKIPNNPRRWRELLTEWRADAGLPAIE